MYDPRVVKNARTRNLFLNGDQQRKRRKAKRLRKPVVQIYDGDWTFAGRIDAFINEAEFQWKLNDTGDCRIVIPTEGPKALTDIVRWLLNPWGRPRAKNVGIRMDKDGGRWCGRASSVRIVKDSNGTRSVVIEGQHEYEELKRILIWPNPFLPAAVQFPKAFTQLGKAAWIVKNALHCNLMRLQNNMWALPDDPLDPSSPNNQTGMQNWSVVVKPGLAKDDKTPGQLFSSRMQNWHDASESILADAQLMVETRRWFAGDPEPWPGAKLRSGAMVVDVVDKSGYWQDEGTSVLGNIWSGFVRTIQTLLGNNIDTKSTIVDEPIEVPEYREPEKLGTVPSAPYVMYRDEPITGVESIDFTWQPSTTVQVVTGGSSMPGVNEGISAAVQAVGNALGTFVWVPTAGTIADTILKPLYSDVFLAWMSIKSNDRANEAGWSRLQEYFAEGADQALTLSSLVAIRKAFWDTRERFTHQIEIADGAPWFIGDQGEGHFWLGDRIGTNIRELPDGKVIVEQVSELTFHIARDDFGWRATVGDFAANESETDVLLRNINKVSSTLRQHGVWS